MGYLTRLSGRLTIDPAAFDIMTRIDALGWRWNENTVDEYLGEGWAYDPRMSEFTINAHRPMHNHRRFMGLLAWFKSGSQTDTLEQEGAVQDAWFDSGRYFIKAGTWGYVGRGTMVVGPESVLSGPDEPKEPDVYIWEPAIPPIAAVDVGETDFSIGLSDGTTFRCPHHPFYDFCRLSDEEKSSLTVYSDRLVWRRTRGEEVTVPSEKLWAQRSHRDPAPN